MLIIKTEARKFNMCFDDMHRGYTNMNIDFV
jgi:hypothetical protein